MLQQKHIMSNIDEKNVCVPKKILMTRYKHTIIIEVDWSTDNFNKFIHFPSPFFHIMCTILGNDMIYTISYIWK